MSYRSHSSAIILQGKFLRSRDDRPEPQGSRGFQAVAVDFGEHRKGQFSPFFFSPRPYSPKAEALASLYATAEDFRLPFRRHLAPLGWPKGWEGWDDTTASKALTVWTGRDLVRDMAAMLERRLIEAQRRHFANQGKAELPLRGCRPAPLAAVAAFLAGRTDDIRIAALAAGLAWAKSRRGALSGAEREDALPFAYAALKPLFVPEGVGPDTGEKRLLDPLPLVRLIRAGRAEDAVKFAQRMARGAGLPAPFAQADPAPPPDPTRLAAALLFPIAPMAQSRLIARAYPDLTKEEEKPHAA